MGRKPQHGDRREVGFGDPHLQGPRREENHEQIVHNPGGGTNLVQRANEDCLIGYGHVRIRQPCAGHPPKDWREVPM